MHVALDSRRATVDYTIQGEYGEAAISAGADLLLFLKGLAAAGKLGQSGSKIVSALGTAYEAGLGLYRAGQAIHGLFNNDGTLTDAAGPAGEALLRILLAARGFRGKAATELLESGNARKVLAPNIVKPLTQSEQAAIRKIGNIEKGHLTPGDFTGSLRDVTGNPVPKPGGGFWDHAQEMNNSLRGLRNAVDKLKDATDPAGVAAREKAMQLIQQILDHTAGAGI